MICFHHNDADGRCSAAIVKRWHKTLVTRKRLVFVEMDYARRVPLEDIKRDDIVVIVDFSFKPDDMKAALAATDLGAIWCDHHQDGRSLWLRRAWRA